MSLKGWTLPQTATGNSALVSPPPWHYSGEIISVEFQANLASAQALLPDGFTSINGSGVFLFADWCSAADTDRNVISDPAIGQYREAFCVLLSEYKGETVGRVPFIWVDNDLSLVRGLIQGFPKKLGQIHMTRPVEVGRGGVRKEPGAQFNAHVSANGRRLVTASVDLDEDGGVQFPTFMAAPLIHTRLWPSFNGDPSVHEFQRAKMADPEIGTVFTGNASLEFGSAASEEIDTLGRLQAGRGYVHSFAFSVTGGDAWPVGG